MREYEDFDKTVSLQNKIDERAPERLEKKRLFLNNICRDDCRDNVTFVALASLCDKDGFKNFSSQAYMNATIEALYINGVQINKVRMDKGSKFSLKPGKYGFKVDFHIEYAEEEDWLEHHPFFEEDRTLEKIITVDEDTDYYLALTYTLISHWEAIYANKNFQGYKLKRWETHYDLGLSTKASLDKAFLLWEDGLDKENKFYYRPTKTPKATPSTSSVKTTAPSSVKAPQTTVRTSDGATPSSKSVSQKPQPTAAQSVSQGPKIEELLYTNGYYKGEVKDGKAHGQGTYKWYSGVRYEGSWVNGKMSGYGKYYYKNGDRYEGEWKDGIRHGKGVYYFANGEKIVGEWKDGTRIDNTPAPTSTQKSASASTSKTTTASAPKPTPALLLEHSYTFANAKRGAEDKTLTFSDCQYVGRVKDGKPHLVGTYYYDDGSIYAGQISSGVKEGYGIIIYKNGDYYQGEIIDGKRHGFGFFHTQDGFVYAGLWENDNKNLIGLRISKLKNGQVQKYHDNKMTEILYNAFGLKDFVNELTPDIPVQYTFIEDDFYMGSFRNGVMEGFGRYMSSGGATYIGQMKDNDFCGYGAYRYKTGKMYIGQFEGSCFNGFGIMIDEKGRITVGRFKDDKLTEELY